MRSWYRIAYWKLSFQCRGKGVYMAPAVLRYGQGFHITRLLSASVSPLSLVAGSSCCMHVTIVEHLAGHIGFFTSAAGSYCRRSLAVEQR